MVHTLLVDAVGSCIAIDLTALDDAAEAAVHHAWADSLADASAQPVATVTPRSGPLVHMLSSLSQQVTLAGIEAARGKAWMLHAAGIATPDGRVVVLVGPSGRGKTTASRALGQVFGYVSDETIAIDEDGRVWPYRKPLSVIEDRNEPKTQHPPSALGLKALPDAELRVAAVVLLDRDERHPEHPLVEAADLGDVLDELVLQTSFLHDHPTALRFIVALAEATGGIRRVRYREASTLPEVIPELVAHTAAPIRLPELPEHAAPPAHDAHDGPRFSRVPVADEVALEDPDRIAVLILREGRQGHVTVLGGIAPAVWRIADGATLPQLVDAAIAAYGQPEGDAHGAVVVAVGQLLDAGLLTSDEPLLARREDVAWVGSDDRIVALALDAEPGDEMATPAALTGSAALVWDWLEKPITLTQLTARATETAGEDASSADVAAQMDAFIAQLTDSKLVEARPASAPAP